MYDNITFKIVKLMSYSWYKHAIKYCEKEYERPGKTLFWSIKNSGEILDKLKAKDFNATSLPTLWFFYSLHYFTS